jgi:hypothetical protein
MSARGDISRTTVQVQVQVCFTSVCGQVQPLDVPAEQMGVLESAGSSTEAMQLSSHVGHAPLQEAAAAAQLTRFSGGLLGVMQHS